MRRLALILIFVIAQAMLAAANSAPEEMLRLGQADQARQILNEAVQKNPNDAQSYHLLCRLYFQLELWDNSLKMAEKSVALEPGNSSYHQWLGRAAGRKAENSNPLTAFNLARRVRAEFERAVALDGNNLSARTDLSEYYMEAPGFLGGDKNKSRQQADAIGKTDPALATYIYARVEEKQSNPHAEQQYKKAISDSGNQSRYWTELAYFYRRAGRMPDMEAAISQSLVAPHHNDLAEYDGAYLLLRTGRNFSGATQMLRRYVNSENVSEDGPRFHAHLMLGELLEKQGDRKGAANEYRAALAMASEYRAAHDALARVTR